MNLFSKAMTL